MQNYSFQGSLKRRNYCSANPVYIHSKRARDTCILSVASPQTLVPSQGFAVLQNSAFSFLNNIMCAALVCWRESFGEDYQTRRKLNWASGQGSIDSLWGPPVWFCAVSCTVRCLRSWCFRSWCEAPQKDARCHSVPDCFLLIQTIYL